MKKIIALTLMAVLAGCSEKNTPPQREDYTRFVNVFTGTGGEGNRFPGATRPFSMVRLNPDTRPGNGGGYNYGDTLIRAFTHTNLLGSAFAQSGDVALLPYTGDELHPVGRFRHSEETAHPGYYGVLLNNYGVLAELTTTERVGLHRYTYPEGQVRKILLDLSPADGEPSNKLISNTFAVISDTDIAGTIQTGELPDRHVIHYRITFSEPASGITVRVNDEVINHQHRQLLASDDPLRIYFEFPPSARALMVKTGLSPVDLEGSDKNIRAELPGWDFDKVKQESGKIWNDRLSTVRIEGLDDEITTNFYTALYHTMTAPILWQDADGRYPGIDRVVRIAPQGYTNYTSLDNTTSAYHPLMTIIQPDFSANWGEVLLQGYVEGDILPAYPSSSDYSDAGTGYPAVCVLADLQSKGLLRESSRTVKEAAARSSIYRPDIEFRLTGKGDSRIAGRYPHLRDKYGYVPADSADRSLEWGLAMAYHDWCVAQIALADDDEETYNDYMDKSRLWIKYFDKETGSFKPVTSDGRFADTSRDRGLAYSVPPGFYIFHDTDGYITELGGQGPLEAALDNFFDPAIHPQGQIGAYDHGRTDLHYLPYLYGKTESAYKGQQILDTILRFFYKPTPAGLPGNDGTGLLSAWYVLNSLGLYQPCPGTAVYSFGRPLIDRAEIDVPGGVFEIKVHDNSPDNKYIKEMRLNGTPLNTPRINYSDIMAGGTLEFFMGNEHRKKMPLRFYSRRWDFGTIAEADGRISHTFRYENTTTEPVVIESIYASCACTVTDYKKQPIRPGEKGEIKVVFNPEFRSGRFSSNLSLKLAEGVIFLTITGEIIPREPEVEEIYPYSLSGGVRISDDHVLFGRLGQGSEKTVELDIINTGDKSASVEVSSTSERIRIDAPARIDAGRDGKIRLSYDIRHTEVYGVYEDTLTLKIDGTPSPRTIPVRTFCIDDFTNVDRRYAPRSEYSIEYENAGNLGRNTKFEKEVTVMNHGKDDLIIRWVGTNDNATADLREGLIVPPLQSRTFSVTLRTDRAGSYSGIVRIIQNDPAQSIHQIKIDYKVR